MANGSQHILTYGECEILNCEILHGYQDQKWTEVIRLIWGTTGNSFLRATLSLPAVTQEDGKL